MDGDRMHDDVAHDERPHCDERRDDAARRKGGGHRSRSLTIGSEVERACHALIDEQRRRAAIQEKVESAAGDRQAHVDAAVFDARR